MGVLAEGNAVGGVVVAAVGELMDMAGVNNGAGIECDQPVTCLAKAECQFASHRHSLLCQSAFSGDFQETQKK